MPVFQVEMLWRCSACRTEVLGRHKACLTCGKPKNEEDFYSSEPASVSDRVTDPALLALALAGPDWECRFCRNRQSNAQSACGGCGAPRESTPATPRAVARAGTSAAASPSAADAAARLPGSVAMLFGVLMLAGWVSANWGAWLLAPWRPRDVQAQVVSRSWKHSMSIERYQVVDGQGFKESRPVDAFDVVLEGQRHHHNTQVRDGTTLESYTQRVACGQDCRTTSVSCRSNNNGFKTCSGGDRVCSTRYCSEVRYRTVPRYATVSVDEPWYRWHAWQWKPQRVIEKTGAEEVPFWPEEAEVGLDVGCRNGERERAERQSRYEVIFADAEHEEHRYEAHDADEFRQLAPGTSRTLRVARGKPPEIVKGDDAQ